MTHDLVEEVARAVVDALGSQGEYVDDHYGLDGVTLDGGLDMLPAARAAIAIVLKRAAEVVAELPWHVDMSPDHIRSRKPEEYATAILSLGEQEGRENG